MFVPTVESETFRVATSGRAYVPPPTELGSFELQTARTRYGAADRVAEQSVQRMRLVPESRSAILWQIGTYRRPRRDITNGLPCLRSREVRFRTFPRQDSGRRAGLAFDDNRAIARCCSRPGAVTCPARSRSRAPSRNCIGKSACGSGWYVILEWRPEFDGFGFAFQTRRRCLVVLHRW